MKVVKKEDKALILTTYVGEASKGCHEKMEILHALNGAPVIRFNDGTQVGFDWEDIVDMAIIAKESFDEKD